jgi:hypothetical protein
MINLLFVCWGIEMRIQRLDSVETAVAHVTFPISAVECEISSRVCHLPFFFPFNLLDSNEPLRVTLVNGAQNIFTGKRWGTRAGAFLQVMGEATGGRIIGLAKRT